MKVEAGEIHMIKGDGETSYARNSRIQEKAILETKQVLQKAIKEVHMSLSPGNMMVVADLGCSSGPNTFLIVSEVINTISAHCEKLGCQPTEIQFFLNDLPGNDFNLIFQSLEQLEKLILPEKGDAQLPPFYVAGLPGSFYTRLFPSQSVNFFHSSSSLTWLSKVPEELSRGIYLNEGNIYIGKTTPPPVLRLYQEQFQKDFLLFLELRSKELIFSGQMALAFSGRKDDDDIFSDTFSCLWGLLAQAFEALVLKGLVDKEKLDSFNVPFYAPSINEVKVLIKQNGMFDISHINIFEMNCDPYDDLDGNTVLDSIQNGENIAKGSRAVVGPLVTHHFGESILDELFVTYAQNIAKQVEKEKMKCHVIVLSLKKRH